MYELEIHHKQKAFEHEPINRRLIPCRRQMPRYTGILLSMAFTFLYNCHPNQTNNAVLGSIPEMPVAMRTIQDSIDRHYLGVAGTGFIGRDEYIGFCVAEKYKGGSWKPIDGYKHTVCGKIPDENNRINELKEENSGDGDVDIYLYPNEPFKWLIKNSLRPSGSYFQTNAICGEIAFKEPDDDVVNDGAVYLKNLPNDFLKNNDICMYGAWVSDGGHSNTPEIHPIQQMWFVRKLPQNITEYHLYSMYDNSKRFNDPNDFNNCSSPGWISIPLINTFYISFSIPLSTGPISSSLEYYREVYTIEMPSSNNINLYPIDSGEISIDALGKTRVLVKKTNKQFPKISVSDLGQYGGNLRGFLKIETSIMKPYTGDNPIGAHAFLKVTKKRITIAPATTTQD